MILRCRLLAGTILAFCTLACAAQEPIEAKKAQSTGPLYSLPYAPGTEYLVGQGYNEFPTHVGQFAVDWLMPEETPILAVCGGVVTEVVASFSKSGLTEDMKNKANYVVIRHDDGSYAIYVHLAQDGARVNLGQRVAEGEEIALSGNTGYSSTPHLHFMAYRMNNGRRESFPALFKSGEDKPFSIVPQAKYRAPGGIAKADEGPLAGIEGTGELSSIRPRLVQVVRDATSLEQGAVDLKRHLLRNREAYKRAYKETFARSRTGDKRAMKELQDFLGGMDLQSQPDVAAALHDPAAAGTAQEAMLVWWDLFALP